MAKELQPIIEVENGFGEEGSFMLTTIRMGRANMYSYLIAKWSEYQEIYPLDEIRSEEETDEEYIGSATLFDGFLKIKCN